MSDNGRSTADDPGELDDPADDPRDAELASDALTQAGAVALEIIGSSKGLPGLGVLAALSTPYARIGLQTVFARTLRGIGRATDEACAATGLTADELAEIVAADDAKTAFAADVMSVASETDYQAKLVVLGRALAAGVTGVSPIDLERLYVRGLVEVEEPHILLVSVLRQLERQMPTETPTVGTVAIMEAMPAYGSTIFALLSTLNARGLISTAGAATWAEFDTAREQARWHVTTFGEDVLDRVVRAGGAPGPVGESAP